MNKHGVLVVLSTCLCLLGFQKCLAQALSSPTINEPSQDECKDGVDESISLCANRNHTKVTLTMDCIVPHLQNLIMKNSSNELVPGGGHMKNGSELRFSCQMNHHLIGDSQIYCRMTVWDKEFPYCRRPIELSFILVITLIASLCVVMLYMIYRLQRDWQQPKDRVWYMEASKLSGTSFPVNTSLPNA